MGISKPLVILRLQPSHSLGVPLCMMNNIMHLTANLSDLMITLWCSEITCMSTDHGTGLFYMMTMFGKLMVVLLKMLVNTFQVHLT